MDGVEPASGGALPDPAFWHGKRVFLTGHTGFKGGWLALWLRELGAIIRGYALEPPTVPNLFTLAQVSGALEHQIGDIRDLAFLNAAVADFSPDIVVHLAAQSILRRSYDEPVETYATNLMGTVHLLEAARCSATARVVLVITTDKCYENREQVWPYRENDPMGGHDPYSSSKGCAELAVAAYGKSYFNTGKVAVATARAGNVIGGGDWARDRLVTDIVAALIQQRQPVIRNPYSIRPWQHVLEPLSGYLCAIEYLWKQSPAAPQSWNFGPEANSEICVAEVAEKVCSLWGFQPGLKIEPDARRLHEAHWLSLDSSKARFELGWRPRLPLQKALSLTVDWYRAELDGNNMQSVTLAQIQDYQENVDLELADVFHPHSVAQ